MLLSIGKRLSEISLGIILCVLALTVLGLLSLQSVAQHQETTLVQTSFFKQLMLTFPALIGLSVFLFVPRRLIHKTIYGLYFLILAAILIPYFGETVAGTHRWIDLGLFVIQPSEFAKWIIVITLARFLSDHNLEMRNILSLVFPISIALIPALVVLKQPDLGTAIILMTPVIPMLYWAGARPYHMFLILAPFFSVLTAFHTISFTLWVVLMAMIIYISRPKLLSGVVTFFTNIFLGLLAPVIWNSLRPYQQNRILTLFNPDLDPLGAAYQIIQSQTAIGSGGLFGKGWGQGTQTQLKFLPTQESDFIMSVIGEELGFVTVLITLLVFAWLILKILKLAYNSNDRFSSLVLLGIVVIFLAHVFVNTAMTVGLIPVKGLPLPFVSYGGSFLLSSYMMIGLVLNLSINYPE